MAIYTQLPIYKVAYDLLSIAIDYGQHMPRPFKAIGDRLRTLCVDIVLLICQANSVEQKAPHITSLLQRNEELQLLLRICQDKRFISKTQYAKAIEIATSVGKQANGWRNKYATLPAT